MEIERAYLQWVGSRFFPTAKDFVEEAVRLGVSRRLPNLRTAAEVARPGTVIFLLHSNGQRSECMICIQAITCPKCGGQDEHCGRCKGLGSVECGTGGTVSVDGETWPYLRYVKLRRKPQDRFWSEQHVVEGVEACTACGGRGAVFGGSVLGFFIPDAVEYVARPDESGKRAGFKRIRVLPASAVRDEPRRSDRRRKAGAYYAVTRPPKRIKRVPVAVKVVEQLADMGKLSSGDVEYSGRFVWFPALVPYWENYFRGLKRFRLDGWDRTQALERKD